MYLTRLKSTGYNYLMKNNLKDKKILNTLFLAAVLIFLHSWQFVKSGYQIEPLLNLIMIILYIPLALFWGWRCVPFYLLAYAFVWLPFEEFDEYTSLLLFCSAVSLNRRLRVCIIPYCVETLVIYINTGLQISHISITAVYILFFWNIYIYIQESKIKNLGELNLKPEEEKILIELCKGKQQKEIDFYSPQTVSRKLKEASERNNCFTPEELKLRYKYLNQFN